MTFPVTSEESVGFNMGIEPVRPERAAFGFPANSQLSAVSQLTNLCSRSVATSSSFDRCGRSAVVLQYIRDRVKLWLSSPYLAVRFVWRRRMIRLYGHAIHGIPVEGFPWAYR